MSVPFLPDEIIAKILPLVHPDDILNSVRPASHRFHDLATDPLLWRHICVSHFRAFSPEHDFEALLNRPPRDVDWVALYRLRKWRNTRARHLLEEMAGYSMLQLDKLKALCGFDYDVKEFLIEQCQASPYHRDGLSSA